MLITVLLFLPICIALLLLFTKGNLPKYLAFGASLVELALTLFAVQELRSNPSSEMLSVNETWINTIGVSFRLSVDGISMLMLVLTNVLIPFILLSSFKNNYERPSIFYSLTLVMQTALVGVFVAMDGLLFYVFWELALIPIYFICLFWGGEGRGKITFKFFLYTIFGSLFMLVALIYLYIQTPGTHSFDITSLYAAGRALPLNEQTLVFFGIFVAFAIKIPIFPFHTWQPDTYTVAPAQGSMLLSAIMLKMGLYGLIRWLLPMVPQAVSEWGNLVMVLCVIGIIYASIIAVLKNDMKRLIAYSSIAHVGLIAAGIFSLNMQGMQGAMVQMISHGINVFGLFYIADIVEKRTNTRLLDQLGGIRTSAPILATCFMIIMLGSVALPFTNGFVGEFLLINGVYQYNAWMAAAAGLTIILGAIYMLRAYKLSMLGEAGKMSANVADLDLQEKLVLFPLVGIIVFFGLYPKPLLDISEPAVNSLIQILTSLKTQ